MTEHSNKIGGSSAARAIACPGSIPLSAKLPDSTSEFAAEGTALHNCMERILEDPELKTTSLIGTKQTVDGYEIEITEELHNEKIIPALEAFDRFLDEIEQVGGAEAEFGIEERVEWGRPLLGCFGTGDVIGRAGKVAFILDWKFGDGVMVDAKDNTQLRFYAGAGRETQTTAEYFDGVEQIWTAIVQPSNHRDDPLDIDRDVTHGDLDILKNDLVQALHNSVKGIEAMAIGPHCRWCKVKPECPLMHNTAVEKIEREINVDNLEEDLRLVDELEDWIKSVRTLAHESLERGIEIPGWKLVAKRAMRKWVDEDKVLAWARKQGLVTKLFPQKLITPAQAAKVTDLPEEFVKSVSSGTTLAPADDKRKAVPSTAGIAKVAKQARSKT
ncbi:MAG: DUF2800 domain-containing protein [Woeseiaceae bacterium]|nr:DUF2800 domain-containing protein [Woeseiaceae bacterium]